MRDPASDMSEVRRLSPKAAIARLTSIREQSFLRHALAEGALHTRKGVLAAR